MYLPIQLRDSKRFSFSGDQFSFRIMKRIRISTASNAKPRRNGTKKGKASHIKINYSGPSFSDLPDNILVNTLLRLPVKRIFVCKCVCKTWYDLISDPDFAKLHFNQAQFYPLLRTPDYTKLSCMLYLVQPEQDDFEHKLDMCYETSPIKIKLDSNFKLPLRNIQMIPKNICKNLNMRNHNYKIVNSCNGLLCLSNPSDNEPVIVCNPVTGEFINLPQVRTLNEDINRRSVECGFGFSPVSNQYKVVRMFARSTGLARGDEVIVVEVHVLGTETWRVVHSSPKSKYVVLPTYLNGCVYWFSNGNPHSVISFDIENECFESISVPPQLEYFYSLDKNSMGVLGGELFVSASGIGEIRIWTMKDDGAEKSWTQIFDLPENDDDDDDEETWPYYGSYQLIKGLNNGSLLMFNSDLHALLYKDPRKAGFRYLKVRGFRTGVEAIAHIPSFVPLKHALSGHNVEVLNVKSRWADLKLHKEGKGISIVEEDKYY